MHESLGENVQLLAAQLASMPPHEIRSKYSSFEGHATWTMHDDLMRKEAVRSQE